MDQIWIRIIHMDQDHPYGADMDRADLNYISYDCVNTVLQVQVYTEDEVSWVPEQLFPITVKSARESLRG